MTALDVRVAMRRGAFLLDVAFRAESGRVTALFGPSGAGKSTTLRAIAGLERPDAGRVALDGEVWFEGVGRRFVPAHRRGVGYVFQEPSLFPHLDVRGNLEFALRRTPPERRRVAFDEAVAWFGVSALLDRPVAGLSGGERQRVALARTVLSSPRVLLLDEPVSSLDVAARREVLRDLDDLAERLGVPVVLVSHDLDDVARLAERVVRVEAGRSLSEGETDAMLLELDPGREGEPLGGLLPGEVVGRDEEDRLLEIAVPGARLFAPDSGHEVGDRVRVRILARDLVLSLEEPRRSSLLNELRSTVRSVEDHGGGESLVRLELEDSGRPLRALVTTRSVRRLGIAAGVRLFASVKAVRVLA